MAAQHSQQINWWIVAGFWAAMAAILAVRAVAQAGTVPLLADTDDAMRIVTATDLLNGQPWQDLTQYRDNAPFGGDMHWSRLVDAPIALLMLLARPVFGTAAADVAAIAWPLLLLLGLLALSVAITRRLVPEGGIVAPLVLPVVNLVLAIEFAPGRVDHHNVQVLLTGGIVLSLLVARGRWTGGAWAGVLAATSLAIGIETLPLVATAVAAIALCWAADPHRHRAALAAFGASFALATLGHWLLATAPSAYGSFACDMLSGVHVIAAALGGGALMALAIIPPPATAWQRLALLAALGGLVLGAAALAFPTCLGGFAGVDPRVVAGQFERTDELQSLLARFAEDPASAIAFASTVIAAIAVGIWRAARTRGEQRADWLILIGFLAVAAAFMLLQIRGARLAALFAIPAICWLIAGARQRYLERHSIPAIAMLVGAWLLGCTLVQFLALSWASAALTRPATAAASAAAPRSASAAAASAASGNCQLPADYAALAALPVGAVAAPRGISAHILRYTPHSVLSAGYHRNAQSIIDGNAFFAGTEAEARTVAETRGLDYVAACAGSARYSAPRDAGWPWTWVTPLSAPDAPLQIYRIELD